MNLLFLTYQGDLAGSTNSIYFLTKGLAEKGHQVYMGCRKESLLYQMLSNTQVHLLPMTFKGKLDRTNMRQIRDAVHTHKIQLINAQSSRDRYTSIFARWLYKLPVKLVHTRRQTPASIGGWLQNTFYVRGTDKIVVISDGLKKTFADMGIPESHMEVIYNGIPHEKFASHKPERTEELRKQYGLSASDRVIGFVSRRKKQEQLLKALPLLPDDLKVMFVGIERKDLEVYIKKTSIRQELIFTGKVPMEDVINYYPLFDCKVLASITDGFGLVLVEAMAMGVPVVGTNSPGIQNVIEDGVSGLLFENEDINELADKIRQILEKPDLRNRLIQNGKERAYHTFSIENTLTHYEDFFLRLIREEGNYQDQK